MRAYREKKLLVGSDDYGRDLTGVQNLRKKHKRLEAELSSHEPSIQVSVCEAALCALLVCCRDEETKLSVLLRYR